MSDEIRPGDPDRPSKKKAPPPDDDDDRPRKKRRSRDEDEDDDDEPVRKKRRSVAQDDDANDIGNSPLGAVVPLGVSVWALLSFYLSLLSCFVPGLGLLAIILGIVAFVTGKHKATYGSISGNMRAVLGIVIGLATTVFWLPVAFLFLTGALR